MKLDYNCTGADRKKLVAAIAEHLGQKAKYLGAPSFAYQVDCITIDKNGVLQMNDMADPGWVEGIEKKLADSGFECVSFSYDNPQPEPTQEEAHEDSSDADFTERVRAVTKAGAPCTRCQRQLAAKFQFI